MWRALVFLALLAAAAFGAVQLAERPGTINVVWSGYQVSTTFAVGVVLLIALAATLAFLWAVMRGILRLPRRWGRHSREQRRAQGYAAVSRGMVAVGAGDPNAARRHAREAERLLGSQPLTLLLKAQAAQVSGDRGGAEAAFRRMLEEPDTRVLGLRGLFVEARRRGDGEAAQSYALEAARLAPAATWANEAMLEAQSAAGDWRGAVASLERRASLGLVDKPTARRHRAVLLTADALARAERNEDGVALDRAQNALKLAPELVPAATLAGRLLAKRGDLRRAAKVIERAWRAQPHPDLADAYLNLRAGDSAFDRLRRAETLAKLSSWTQEGRLAVAQAAMEARDFARARQTLKPLLEGRPTMRTCLLMADLEQAEHGASGRAREWLARAARAPRDPAWIADGVVSDRWAPLSPVTGRLDAFEWKAPPDVLTGPGQPIDDVVGDVDDKPPVAISPPPTAADAPPRAAPTPSASVLIHPAPAPEPQPIAAPPSSPAPAPPVTTLDDARPAVTSASPVLPSSTEPALPIGPAPVEGVGDEAPVVPEPAPPARAVETSEGGSGAAGPAHKANGASRTVVVYPPPSVPDDPGPEPEEAKPSRFKLFG